MTDNCIITTDDNAGGNKRMFKMQPFDKTDQEWSATNWIKSFCDLGGLVLPHTRTVKWSEAVTDFDTMPTNIDTLALMSRCMIQLDSAPDRRNQVFAVLGS